MRRSATSRRVCAATAASFLASLAVSAGAVAHPERPTTFRDGSGEVPRYRDSGPKRVVCKPESERLIERELEGRIRTLNEQLLEDCRYRHIQEAVNAAENGDRIMILPGTYREGPSRRAPTRDPRCAGLRVGALSDPDKRVASYAYQQRCPNDENLIAILGDSDNDGDCDAKCNLQIEGTGSERRHVTIIGDQRRLNIFKADRADGIYFRNMRAQFSDYNNFYVLETDGFRFDEITSRWSREYGFLSFMSDHGVYEDLNTYGAGDAGVYPGSGPPLDGKRFGIVVRRVNSHHNLQGNSGSAASSTLYKNNRFHHNGVGIVVDSFSTGHPGSPQDHVTWRGNRIYSNNQDYFTDELDRYCMRPYVDRDPKIVCPALMVPSGTGLLIAGGNDNLAENNWIYDNWRHGVELFFVEATFRGEEDLGKLFDTSHGNTFLRNKMGIRPNGKADPNGVDFWWDEQGGDNCWAENTALGGAAPTADPAMIRPAQARGNCPAPGGDVSVNALKHAILIPCATHDEMDNPNPPGCPWNTIPPEPKP